VRVQFADFTFDTGTRELRWAGELVPLSGKAFAVLRVLLEERPNVVTKQELLRRVWPDTAVEEANLSVAIAQIRRALSDDAQGPRFIRTDHGTGYAFVAEVAGGGASRRATEPQPSTRFWLVWDDNRVVLYEGENIVGRDPRHPVWLDAPRVSGRHAVITIAGTSATVEDLASLNGTYLRGARLTGPERLSDGDVIRFGTSDVTFRAYRPTTERVGAPRDKA
jgi:DNA-binding winged helix-turn-helix (wHTH) protein